MDKTGWTTHCFGRFLVDLPPQAKISQTYKIWGEEIKRLYETPESLAKRINRREQELRTEQHETKGAMFVKRVDYGNGSVNLLSWDAPHHEITWRHDTYLVANGDWRAFHKSGLVSQDRAQRMLDSEEALSKHLLTRKPSEIPAGPGYCIDGGFIAGKDYRAESFSVDVKLPNHPGAYIEIFASTGAEEDRLLDRVGGFLRTEVMGPAVGLNTLRKRKRDVGPIDAEEYLVAGSDQGQRVYSFAWESQGKDNSLAEPNLGVNLSVLGQSVVSEKEPYRPAFRSDEDALELWDAIIESIRLWPGAA